MTFPTNEEGQQRAARVDSLQKLLSRLLTLIEKAPDMAVRSYHQEVVPHREFIKGVEFLESMYQELLPKLAENGRGFLLNLEWEVMEEPTFDEFYNSLAEEELSLAEDSDLRDFDSFLYAVSRKLPEAEGMEFYQRWADSNDARLWYSENPVLKTEEVPEPSDFLIGMKERFNATFQPFSDVESQADAGIFEAHFEKPERLVIRHPEGDPASPQKILERFQE